MSKTLREIVGKNVRDLKSIMLEDKAYGTQPKETLIPLTNPELIIGLELEIEHFPAPGTPFHGFEYHEDGSLRNNGVEYVTYPTKTKLIPKLLSDFFKKFYIRNDTNYSERTSTHVHVNMLDLTLSQIATFCMLYQVFERLLFSFVGNDRDKNIFCVPWHQANVNVDLSNIILNGGFGALRRWVKYTALNLLPLQTKGTVEFRHLEGTCDLHRILIWVNILGSMHKYAVDHPFDEVKQAILELNTNSAYDVFMRNVFSDLTPQLQTVNYQRDLEDGVINVKLMSLTSNQKSPVGLDAILENLDNLREDEDFPDPDEARTVQRQIINNAQRMIDQQRRERAILQNGNFNDVPLHPWAQAQINNVNLGNAQFQMPVFQVNPPRQP